MATVTTISGKQNVETWYIINDKMIKWYMLDIICYYKT